MSHGYLFGKRILGEFTKEPRRDVLFPFSYEEASGDARTRSRSGRRKENYSSSAPRLNPHKIDFPTVSQKSTTIYTVTRTVLSLRIVPLLLSFSSSREMCFNIKYYLPFLLLHNDTISLRNYYVPRVPCNHN